MKKTLCVLLSALMLLAFLAACNGDSPSSATPTPPSGGQDPATPTPGDVVNDDGSYKPPPSDVEVELDIMMWSGSGTYLKDIGHQDFSPQDLVGQNEAAAYATAKAFNQIFPNVKINIFAKEGDPNQDDSGLYYPWAQHIENFRAEHGKYPDFYCPTDLPGDIQKGMVADISRFAHDPVYQSFNPGVMAMMNFSGRQFALPQYLLPWGVYVNKSLAEDNNIDVPPPNWTIDQYTAFTGNSNPSDWWFGAMDAPRSFFPTGSKGFHYNLVHRGPDDPYVNIATEEFYNLMSYIPRWANHAVHPQNDLGNVPEGFMGEHWNWAFRFFQMGRLLTNHEDPWMMGDLAHPNPDHWGAAVMSDWDIYPRPSTPELGNTVGVVLDPFAIHNFDAQAAAGNMTQEEADLKLHVAYEFAKFWCADTRAWRARADQMWTDIDDDGTATLKTALNDSLPMVMGDAFDEQMSIWYEVDIHKRFADKNKMPGFHYILELWEKGDIWDVSDKCYPWNYEFEGSTRLILYEYENSWNPELVGASRTDANWLDNIKARMPDWNAQFNQRFADVFANLQSALDRYYS